MLVHLCTFQLPQIPDRKRNNTFQARYFSSHIFYRQITSHFFVVQVYYLCFASFIGVTTRHSEQSYTIFGACKSRSTHQVLSRSGSTDSGEYFRCVICHVCLVASILDSRVLVSFLLFPSIDLFLAPTPLFGIAIPPFKEIRQFLSRGGLCRNSKNIRCAQRR